MEKPKNQYLKNVFMGIETLIWVGIPLFFAIKGLYTLAMLIVIAKIMFHILITLERIEEYIAGYVETIFKMILKGGDK